MWLACAACVASGEVIGLPPGDDYLRVFIVAVGEDNQSTRVLGALTPGAEEDAPISVPEGTSVYAIALTAERIASLHPDVDLEHLELLEITNAPSAELFDDPCREMGVLQPDGKSEWPLERRADIFRVEGAAWTRVETPPAMLSRLGLRVPLREACSRTRLSGRPFAQSSPYFEEGARFSGRDLAGMPIVQLYALGLDEVLAVVDRGVLRLRRGEDYVGVGGHWSVSTSLAAPSGHFWEARDLAPLPTSSSGETEAFLMGMTLRDSDGVTGFGVFRVDWVGGVLGGGRSLLVRESPEADFKEMAVGENGEYIVLADGFIVTATSSGSMPVVDDSGRYQVDVLAYQAGAQPSQVLAGHGGLLWTGDLFSGRPLDAEDSGSQAHSRVSEFIEGVPYLGLDRPPIIRRTESGWIPVPVYLPEAFSSCAERQRVCGRLLPAPRRIEILTGLEDGTGRFLTAFQGCDGVFLIEPRPVEACVVGTSLGWSEHSTAPLPGIFDGILVEGRLLMSGTGGFLYEISVDE